MNEKYTYFWKSFSPFSNWYLSDFTFKDVDFIHMEQYMMWSKAKLMSDEKQAEAILATKSAKACKDLGRGVRPFNSKLWDEKKEQIVYEGCYAKFAQNTKIKEVLLKTEGELVEASPFDKVWGIGLDERKARMIDPELWPGQNLLGKVLTKVRENLKKT